MQGTLVSRMVYSLGYSSSMTPIECLLQPVGKTRRVSIAQIIIFVTTRDTSEG